MTLPVTQTSGADREGFFHRFSRYATSRYGVVSGVSAFWIYLYSTFVMPLPEAVRWAMRTDAMNDRVSLLLSDDSIFSLQDKLEKQTSKSNGLTYELNSAKKYVNDIESENQKNSEIIADLSTKIDSLKSKLNNLTGTYRTINLLDLRKQQYINTGQRTLDKNQNYFNGLLGLWVTGRCTFNAFYINRLGLLEFKSINIDYGQDIIIESLFDIRIKVVSFSIFSGCIMDISAKDL